MDVDVSSGEREGNILPESGEAACGVPAHYVLFAYFGIALLVCLIGPYSNFARPGLLDSWIYTSYAIDFQHLVATRGLDNYYIARLSWIVPAMLVHAFLSPVIATIVLNVLILGICSWCLHLCVARSSGSTAAWLSGLLFATNALVFTIVSTDYPDGAPIAWAFGGFALIWDVKELRWPRVVAAGALFTAAGAANLIVGMVVAPLVFVVALRRWRYWQLWLWLGLGSAACQGVLMILGLLLTGRWSLYLQQFSQVRNVSENPGYLVDMWGAGTGFLLHAHYLGVHLVPAVVGLACCVIWRASRSPAHTSLRVATVSLWLSIILFSIADFGFDKVLMRVYYHNIYLIIPGFLCLGAIAGVVLREVAYPWRVIAAVVVPCIALSSIAKTDVFRFQSDELSWQLTGALLVICVAALVAGRKIVRWAIIAMITTALGMQNSGVLSNQESGPLMSNYTYSLWAWRVQQEIHRGLSEDRPLRTFYSHQSSVAPLYASITSMYLHTGYDLDLMWQMEPDYLRVYTTGHSLVFLLEDETYAAGIVRFFELKGIALRVQFQLTIVDDDGRTVTVLILQEA